MVVHRAMVQMTQMSCAPAGVWDVSNVLDATFQQGAFEPHTLSIEVEDVPGVLNQVSTSSLLGSGQS